MPSKPANTILRSVAAAVGLIGALLVGMAHEAAAYRLVPIVMNFDPSGRGASQTFGVVNDTTEPVAVEITMVKRIVDIDGREANVPEEEDFIVFPPQVVVLPGKVQVVRVRWIGDDEPKTELAYRIVAEQLPIDINAPPKQGGSVQLLLAFEGSIYIVPHDAEPNIVIDSVAMVTGQDGAKQMEVVLHNRGSAHAVLQNPKISLKAGQTAADLSGSELGDILNANILAGNKRRFHLPWPGVLGNGALSATLEAGYLR